MVNLFFELFLFDAYFEITIIFMLFNQINRRPDEMYYSVLQQLF